MPPPPPDRRRPLYRDWNTPQLAALAPIVTGQAPEPPPGPLRRVKTNGADIHQPGRGAGAEQCFAPVSAPAVGPHCHQGNQPPGDETMKILPVG